MAKIIQSPTLIKAAGNKDKSIEEFIGRVNSGNSEISIARMKSPEGWEEPGQCPEFDEYTIVLDGCLVVKTKTNEYQVRAGQAIIIPEREWVQYSSPFVGGAEYIAVCLPAFSPDSVHRDNL
jgi:mannose-6-phosphate isomerase-like protein (cupin superfamily)